MYGKFSRPRVISDLKSLRNDLASFIRFDRKGSRHDHARTIDSLDAVIAILELVQVDDMLVFEHYLTQQAAALTGKRKHS